MRGPSKPQGGNAVNPYFHSVRNQRLREGLYWGTRALQDPALNLDNGDDWAVDMGRVCGLADEDRDAAFSMGMDVRIHGDRVAAFKPLCREIATQRFVQPQAEGE